MSLEFLSDEWLAKTEELRAAAPDLETAGGLSDLVINVTVRDGKRGNRLLALVGGILVSGHRDGAALAMTMSSDLAKRFFVHGDQLAGLQGYMSGQIRVEGDTTKLKALHAPQLTASQNALRENIKRITS